MTTWTGPLLDLLLPCVCPACRHGPGPGLCPACRAALRPLVDPCVACGIPRNGAESCPACHGRGLPGIATVHVAWEYTGLLRELVGVAKIEGRPAAVAALTDLLPEVRPPAGAVVVPVPPSPGRRSGPHLATACARALGRALGCPVVPALSVTRLAAEQHRLTRPERTRNVAGLFTARPIAAPVLLVDDLLTSGATASAAATVLRGAGAPWVGLVVLGRTV